MGKVNSDGSAPKRRGKRLPAVRVLIFSAAAALGVVAVRRGRTPRDDAPALPTSAAVPTEAGAAPVSVLKKAEPVAATVAPEQPQVAADADADDEEEPPIWAALAEHSEPAEPVATPPLQAAPTSVFEAAFTGAPAEFVQPFEPLPVSTAPANDLSALRGEPWATPPLGATPVDVPAPTATADAHASGKGVLLATPARRRIALIAVVVVLVILTIVVLVV